MNDNIDPRTGVHRIRKKRGKQSKRNSQQQEIEPDVDYAPDESSQPATSAGFEQPAPAYDQQQQQPVVPPPTTGASEPSEIPQYA